jgi:hypothetical protein
MLMVDAFGVAGGAAALKGATRSMVTLMARKGAYRGITTETLVAMKRPDRAKLLLAAIRETAANEEGRRAILAAARAEGIQTAALLNPAGMSVKNGTKLVRIVSSETTKQIGAASREALMNAAQIGVSATPESWTGSGSGAVNWVGDGLLWVIHLVATRKS